MNIANEKREKNQWQTKNIVMWMKKNLCYFQTIQMITGKKKKLKKKTSHKMDVNLHLHIIVYKHKNMSFTGKKWCNF